MAEDQKETFMDKSREYADQYEKALRENAEAFKEIATECIAKGIKTAEEVVNDAKQMGITIKNETLNKMRQAEEFAKGKVDAAKAKVTEVKGKAVDKARDVRDGVVTGAEMVAGAAILTGRLGKNAVIKGAKTVQETYSAKKEDVQKGLKATRSWLEAKRDKIKDKVTEVKGKAVDKARYVRDGVVSTARGAKQAVVDKAGEIRDGVVDGAAKVTGATIATKEIVGDQLQKASSRVQTRANTSIVNFAKSGRSFFDKVFDRLESSAVSREELNQAKQQEREAAKNRELKGQDGQEK